MRKLSTILALGCLFGLFLSLGTANAGICSNVCHDDTDCELPCTAIGGGSPEQTTCGDWGRCDYPSPTLAASASVPSFMLPSAAAAGQTCGFAAITVGSN